MPLFNIANGETGISVRTKLNAKLSPIIDVKADFGAKGDGTTDDTSAIQTALNKAFNQPGGNLATNPQANFPVFFPPGVYKITSPLTVNGTWGAHIFGSGRFTTEIRQTTVNT